MPSRFGVWALFVASLCCGCHATRIAEATTTTLTVQQGGVARTVIVHVPRASASVALPLVLNLHASAATAAGQESYSGMDATADAHGFIVAYPQGAIPLGSGFAWNVPGVPLSGGGMVPPGSLDDGEFSALAIASIARLHPVDDKRVFATGFSGGAREASQLGCDRASLFAAIGPVSGLRSPAPCADVPVAVVTLHGDADTENPYDGNGQAYWTYSVPMAAATWAAHDHCAATATRTLATPVMQLTRYDGCAGHAEVDLYTIDGGAHEWPHASDPANVDANEILWQFFAAHPQR
jgi:polyhydroxybutyrate depolymerase